VLIIGNKYKFIELEKEKLKKYNLTFIKVNDKLVDNLETHIKQNKFEIIVLNTDKKFSNKDVEYLTELQLKIHNSTFKITTIEHFLEEYLGKVYIPKDNSDISFLDNIKPFSKWQYIQKRIIDFSITIPLGIVTIPIMLYSAYRIKKESPDGGVFFKQTRIGKNGKPFTCYKFRSMRTDVEFFDHYTQENDPRIFKWGEIMRKTRIDELPQLWNVIKGDLHLLGPRAEWDELVKKYEKEWSFYHERHLIAPGITGWAQVNYPYGKNMEDTYQKLMYDLYYIKNWSLSLEIKTIFKTAMVMIGRKGL